MKIEDGSSVREKTNGNMRALLLSVSLLRK